MKRLAFILLLGWVFVSWLQAQEEPPMRTLEAMKAYIKAINTHNYTGILPYLSTKLRFGNLPWEFSRFIISQMVSNFPAEIKDVQLDRIATYSGCYIVYFNITYPTSIENERFIFDAEGNFIEIEMFKMMFLLSQSKFDDEVETNLPVTFKAPFHLVEGLILSPGSLNGKNGVWMIDTGSAITVINSPDTRNRKAMSLFLSGFNGLSDQVDIQHIDEIQWGDYIRNDFDCITEDLSEMKFPGESDMLGIIGYALLRNFEIDFDYAAGEMTLHQVDKMGRLLKKYESPTPITKIKCVMAGHLLSFKGSIGGHNYRFGLDSGAAGNIIDSTMAAKLSPCFTYTGPDTLQGGGVYPVVAIGGTIDKVTVNKLEYPNMAMNFCDMSIATKYCDVHLDGILGYEFLRLHPVRMNFRRGELFILPDSGKGVPPPSLSVANEKARNATAPEPDK
jgi:hypothetical protein